MKPTQLGYQLSPDAKGVKALIISRGKSTAALLRWPFYTAPEKRAERKDAAWLLPSYKRPVWGESPAVVADVPDDEDARKAPIESPESKEKITELLNQEAPTTTGKTKTRMVQAPTGKGKRSIEKDAVEPQGDLADMAATAAIDAVAPGLGTGLDVVEKIGNGRRASPAPPLIPQDEPPMQQEDEMG